MGTEYISPSESTIRVYARCVCKNIVRLIGEPALSSKDVDEFTTYLQLIFSIHAKQLNATE